jgi:ADP-heptose:LPS heptosyltransferase
MKIFVGFYYGIGDFVATYPVLLKLSKREDIEIYVAVGEQVRALTKLLKESSVKFIYFNLFSIKKISSVFSLIKEIKTVSPDILIVSPHISDRLSSWKIPILLYTVKQFGYIGKIVGSDSDSNSILYTQQIRADKSLSLLEREFDFFVKTGFLNYQDSINNDIFLLETTQVKTDEIVIHPGASKELKLWPLRYYNELLEMIFQYFPKYKVRFIGLEKDLDLLKNTIDNTSVVFDCKALDKSIKSILHVKVIISMDSLFSHIASTLKIPNIAIFGATDPKLYAPKTSTTSILVKKELPCQYCDALRCPHKENICMTLITPQDVLNKLQLVLKHS